MPLPPVRPILTCTHEGVAILWDCSGYIYACTPIDIYRPKAWRAHMAFHRSNKLYRRGALALHRKLENVEKELGKCPTIYSG